MKNFSTLLILLNYQLMLFLKQLIIKLLEIKNHILTQTEGKMKKLILTLAGIFLTAAMVFPQGYVGPLKCLTCHSDKQGWSSSLHANGYSMQLDDTHTMQDKLGIVNDYDQNSIDDFHDGLDFNTISSVFDPYKPNAPVLAYSTQNGYTIKIGEVTHKVYLTYGGSGYWKQRYAVKINTSEGESADYYISPIQYNEKTHEYVLYHADAWYDSNDDPIYTNASTLADASQNSRSLAKGCSGCHVTGLEIAGQDANGEWIFSGAGVLDESQYTDLNNFYDINGDGTLDQINVGCEKCHGPGEDHAVNFPGDKSKIINPATDLSVWQANNLCGMCHSRGHSKPNGTFGFPFNDDNLTSWSVGDIVTDYYDYAAGYWGDGKNSKSHHQQFLDFYRSGKPNFQYHNVACYECHDPHGTAEHQIVTEVEEEDSTGNPITIVTENDNNTLCLSCHATHGDFTDIPVEWVADYQNHISDIAPIVSAHTNHPYDPDGTTSASRCSKCHNPKVAKSAINYDIHSHTFEAIAPEKTKIFQMPSSCAVSCHRDIENGADPIFNIGVDADLGDWTETTDIALADSLMNYYGPGGIWWDHIVKVERENSGIPETYALSQNFPNPFNPATQINFSIPEASTVKIVVYDIVGREVEVLVNDYLDAGNYSTSWNAANYASGIYLYRMETNGFAQVKKMILMK
ncbi:doubled CXXCH motif [bacterium BMS3Abin03]|nr:doubled CXXCH motif [bacterium BMS3Abin03]